MLVPISQVDFEDVNWSCLSNCINNATDNKTLLQSLIDIVCALPDYTLVNTQCVAANKNPVDLLNALFLKTCSTNPAVNFEEDYTKLMYCGQDNWNVTTGDISCFAVPETNPNEFNLIQALIKRNNTYATIIKQQSMQLDTLNKTFASLQAQINTLSQKITNCCP